MVSRWSLREFVHILLRRKTVFAVMFGIVGMTGGAYLLFKQPLYMSSATLILHFDAQTVPDVGHALAPVQVQGANEHREILNSDAAILRSPDLLASVVGDIGLANLYPRIAAGSGTDAARLSRAVNAFASNLTVNVGDESDVITISFLHPSPVLARDALDALLRRFYEREADVYANPQLAFAKSEADKAKASLTQAQNERIAFNARYGSSNPSGQAQQLLAQRTNVDARLRTAEAVLLQAQQRQDALTRQLKAIPPAANGTVSAAAGDPAADSLETRLSELRDERSRQARTHRPASHVLRELDAQIRLLSRAVNARGAASHGAYGADQTDQNIRTELLRATEQVSTAAAPVQALQAQLKQINDGLSGLQWQKNQSDNLTQATQIQSEAFRSLALRYDAARVEANRNAQRISAAALVSAPMVPTEPAFPRRHLVALGALLAALIVASGTILAVEAIDDRFQTPADVTRILRLPVLATFGGDAD